jgi:isopropylmalate/homocitrate/citramalate synthase
MNANNGNVAMASAVSAVNGDPAVRREQAFAPQVILNDCTLREGEQASEVNFTLEARLRIAEALYEAGIAQVQAGYPGRSDTDFRTIIELRKRFPSWTIEAVTQVFQKDWREQLDRAVDSGADWIDLIYPVSDLRLAIVQKVSREQMLDRAVEAVAYACARAPRVRFAPTDTGRADLGFLETVYKAVVAAGAKRVTVADTVGALHPRATAFLVRRAIAVAGVPVQVHFHDDFGLALANTLAAAEAGASILDGTVIGVGERAGNAAIEELAASLAVLYGISTGAKLERMTGLAALVASVSRVAIPPHKAIVGSHAFAHKLDAHVMGVALGPAAYESVPPEAFGNRRHIGLGRLSGRNGVRARLGQMGLSIDDDALVDALVAEVRTTAEGQSEPVGDEQLLAMLERLRSAA